MIKKNLKNGMIELIAEEGKVLVNGENRSKRIITHLLRESNWLEVDDDIPTPEVLKASKDKVNSKIYAYDHSQAVNDFTYQGQHLWLDRNDRIVLKDRFEREMNEGKEKTNLFAKGQAFDITPQTGIDLINAVAKYADECFDNTQRHYANVATLKSVEEVESYDYTTGYPVKLDIN